ncbi:MAG: hypothetical protein U0704_03655 [Candidatus Eisenbacteria bacterium]
MNPRCMSRRLFVACALLLAVSVAGCSRTKVFSWLPVQVNQRPSVELTSAPASETDTAYYAYEMHWTGSDPDGAVDHFEYAIDPVAGSAPETAWVVSRMPQAKIHFRVWQPDTTRAGARVIAPHTFVIRALDAAGLASPVVSRSFYSYTVAPSVRITSPRPSVSSSLQSGPAMRVHWEGEDVDGVFSQRPVRYKYRLIRANDPEFPAGDVITDPQRAWRYFSGTNFAGWDSTGADSAFADLRGLVPAESPYVFAVVAQDEAGAWSPDWSMQTNLLRFIAELSGNASPRLAVVSPFVQYAQARGGIDPTDVASWLPIDVPGDQPLAFDWWATPTLGNDIVGYRWRVDGEFADETPRTDERTDWSHWSRWSTTATATIGPFVGGSSHKLYLEAKDNFGSIGLLVADLHVVAMSLARDLLVVNDTRLELDSYNSNGTRRNYTTAWPAVAELDTFLCAVGGFTWRGTAAGRAGLSPPGLLSGYAFDTVGTRFGLEAPTQALTLARLGRYRHVLWLADVTAAQANALPTAIVNGISTLRYMCAPGHTNVLASYAAAGGQVWLAGGGAAYCSLVDYNAVGVRANDNIYGIGYTVFSNGAGELLEGRPMFDLAHWRSELVTQYVVTSVRRSPRAVGGWSHAGYHGEPLTAPDYAQMPATLRRRALALGDTLPPTRATSQSTTFFTSGAFGVEYLTQPNEVHEDVTPDPVVVNELATLDTLYELSGGSLATLITQQRPAVMTYYHGVESPRFVFSGLPLWEWTRADCAGLVDFVLQRIWGMQRTTAVRGR